MGYVTSTSEIYGFRRSVRHSFSGWNTHNVTDTAGFERCKEIISGSYFIPDSAATVELRGQKRYYSLLDSCEESSIYFRSLADCTVSAIVNGSERHKFDVAASDEMQKLTVSGHMGRVRWNVGNTGRQYTFYGVTMDCRMLISDFIFKFKQVDDNQRMGQINTGSNNAVVYTRIYIARELIFFMAEHEAVSVAHYPPPLITGGAGKRKAVFIERNDEVAVFEFVQRLPFETQSLGQSMLVGEAESFFKS